MCSEVVNLDETNNSIFMMELNSDLIDMSLDEYIAMSKKNNNSVCSSVKNNNRPFDDNDAKFGRRRGNIDDEEDEDEDILLKSDEDMLLKSDEDEDMLLKSDDDEEKDEVDTGIWKGPDASVAYIACHEQQNDLREKLNTKNNRKVNEVSSVQYRLMAPNNSADRPRGIPTLLPLDANVHKKGGYNNNRRRRRRNRGFNNNFSDPNNTNNHNNHINNRNGVGSVHNGRIQRNKNQDLRKNVRLSFNGNGNFNDRGAPSQGNPKNIVVEFPSSSISMEPGAHLIPSLQVPQSVSNTDQLRNRSMPIGNLTPQAQAALNLNSNPNPVPNPSNDNLKTLLGFQGNVSGEMMPLFASRLLDFLQNGAQAQVHKPIYDMKIQKDIHEIQKKPLLYKCNGGEVISSDGAGVNCKIIPRTSGVSLNCRFA